MIGTLAFATVLLAAPEKWDIKPNLADKSKTVYALTVEAKTDSEEHTAKMNVVRVCSAPDASKNIKAKYSWEGLEVDGNSMDTGASWDVLLTPDGAIMSTTAEEGDDIRRMLSPLTFVYPGKAVDIGDKWSASVKPNKDKDDRQFTWAYEVKGVEKIKEADTLKIAGILSEKGNDPMSGSGTWWIGKDGTVVKFSLDIKGWVVPMAGSTPIDAKMTGEAVPNK